MEKDEIFVVETRYKIDYRTKDPVPINEVIESLRSVEALLKRTPKFIEAAYGGIKVVDVDVYVDSLETGSLTEDFLVRYVFKGEENYEQAKKVMAKIVGDNEVLKTLVAMSVGGMITYGIVAAMGDAQPSEHIEAYNNTIVNIGGAVELDANGIVAILDSIKDKKKLAKESIGAVKPAKADPDAVIKISGIDSLTMPQEMIRDVPSEYTAPTPQEREDRYTDTTILIYASDRDRSESSWAGLVPGVVDKRIKFTLAEGVEPKKLHGRTKLKADITVVSKFNKQKKAYQPKFVEIRKTNIQ